MNRTHRISLANLGLLTMALTGAAKADSFTAATLNGAPPSPNVVVTQGGTVAAPTYSAAIVPGPTDILNAAYYRASPKTTTAPIFPYNNGPVTGTSGYNFFDVEGISPGVPYTMGATPSRFADYGVIRFDLTNVKAALSAHYGGSPYTIKNVYIAFSQSNAGFTYNGIVNVAYTPDDTTNFGYTPVYNSATSKTTFTANFGTSALNDPFKYPDPNAVANGYTGGGPITGPIPAGQELVANYNFQQGGPTAANPYASTGTGLGTGYVDYIPVYGVVPAGLTTSPAPVTNPAGLETPAAPTAPTVEIPALTGQGNTDVVAHIQSSSKITFVFNPGDPNFNPTGDFSVTASWNGPSAFFPIQLVSGTNQIDTTKTNSPRFAPQLIIEAVDAPTVSSVAGKVTLDGVSYPFTGTVDPLDPIVVTYYTPGTKTSVGTQSVTLNSTDGSFSLTPNKTGTFDLGFKGPKNLQVVVPGIDTTKTTTGIAVTLPGGDANNDNRVDVLDFGILVNAYGTSFAGNNGYDPAADFTYDGQDDVLDFGILVNNYGTAGDNAP